MKLLFDSPAKNVLNVGDQAVHGGEEFTVTDSVGDQLLADPTIPVRIASAPASATRDELNDHARAAGIPDPEKLANKTAVVEAINTPASSTSADGPVTRKG